MRPLSAEHILRVWEIGQNQHPLDRALTLLTFALPNQTRSELATLSIGRRDAYLLTLRELTLGPQLNCYAECPNCGEQLEFTLEVGAIRLVDPEQSLALGYQFTLDSVELQFRLPDSIDLAAVMVTRNLEKASLQLMQRCLLQAQRDGQAIAFEELPEEAIAQLQTQMAAADPQAETLLDLACANCQHSWQVLFDIGEFFWAELNAQAKRLLREIHTLARAYGWSEADILAMSASRRKYHLELVSG